MRSINTSLIALLPVAGPAVRRGGLLGVGHARRTSRWSSWSACLVGAYSSISSRRRSWSTSKQREPAHPRAGAARRGPSGPGGCGRDGARRPVRRRPSTRATTTRRPASCGASAPWPPRPASRPARARPAPAGQPRTSDRQERPGPTREAAPVTDGAAVVDDDPLARVGRAHPRHSRLPRAGRRRSATSPRCSADAEAFTTRRRSRSRRWFGARPTSWSGWRRGASCSAPPWR